MRKKKIKTELGIPAENKVIVYSGSMANAKGVGELLKVLPELLEKLNNVTFVFLGYGELVDSYRIKLRELIDQKKVVIYGRIGYFELPKYLMACDYAIDPKKASSEASGKLFNYLDAGLPVLCFENEFNRAILGNSGYYMNDFHDVVQIVREMHDKDLNFVLPDNFNWEKIIDKLIKEI